MIKLAFGGTEKVRTKSISLPSMTLTKKILFAEVKRQKKSISLAVLREKVKAFLVQNSQYANYAIELVGRSLEDL